MEFVQVGLGIELYIKILLEFTGMLWLIRNM